MGPTAHARAQPAGTRRRLATVALGAALAALMLLALPQKAPAQELASGHLEICSGESCERLLEVPMPEALMGSVTANTVCVIPEVSIPLGDSGSVAICKVVGSSPGTSSAIDVVAVELDGDEVRYGEWAHYWGATVIEGGRELQLGQTRVRLVHDVPPFITP